MQTKKILLITTGGTIAGVGGDCYKGSKYQAGVLGGEALLQSLPTAEASIVLKEFYHLDSVEMDLYKWREVAQFIQAHFQEYEGFVITHGTDTLEEAGFFFSLVCSCEKPIVLVGAMRASNAVGADGTKNLHNAIALSCSHAKGVMVLMNDRVLDPFFLSKTHTHNLDAFSSHCGGELGYVLDSEVFLFSSLRQKIYFPLEEIEVFPKVGILPIYAGIGKEDLCFSKEMQGLVVMGCGSGNMSKEILEELKHLQQKGVCVVVASRVGGGFVVDSYFVPSYTLNAPKARILLTLCLGAKREVEEVFLQLR